MRGEHLRTLVAVDGLVDRGLVERVLEDERVRVQGVGDPATGWPTGSDADALLVVCRADSDPALALIQTAVCEHGDRPVVVACTGTPNGFLRRAFAAGAEDVILLEDPLRAGLDTFMALTKAVARQDSDVGHEHGRSEVIVVLGPKGGTGKTLVSTSLAVGLAADGHRATIIDADLQFGDVGLALGLRPDHTSYDLAVAGGTLDADKIAAFLVTHPGGARALLAPTRPDQGAAVSSDLIRDVVQVLRAEGGYVVVDTPPAFTPEVIAAVDVATSVCVVTQLDAPSLKNTKIGLETLGLLGIGGERIRLVLNRSDSNVGISHSDVVHILGRAPDVLVPSSRDVVRAVNAGTPIVLAGRKSEPAKALRALAELYTAVPGNGRRA